MSTKLRFDKCRFPIDSFWRLDVFMRPPRANLTTPANRPTSFDGRRFQVAQTQHTTPLKFLNLKNNRLNPSRDKCKKTLFELTLRRGLQNSVHYAALVISGSFLPFAALWLRVRSDASLAHSTITPATPSPYAPA
mgnify:FL=1